MCRQAGKETDRQEGRQVGSAAMLAGRKVGRQLGRQADRLDREEGHDQEKREGQGRIRAEHT